MRVFVDTNIFLYVTGPPNAWRESCVRVLRRIADGSLDATVNSEVLQEILHVLTRRGRREDGLELAQQVAALFPDLLPVTRDDLQGAMNLLRHHPKLPVRDAVHAATMLSNGLKHVISVDTDFDRIPEIIRIAPGAA